MTTFVVIDMGNVYYFKKGKNTRLQDSRYIMILFLLSMKKYMVRTTHI